jgi:hypothetical protein
VPTASDSAGDVACSHRIARLGLPILPRISQIRNDGGDACGGSVRQRVDKEKKPAQLIVAALPIIAVKGLNNENILAGR